MTDGSSPIKENITGNLQVLNFEKYLRHTHFGHYLIILDSFIQFFLYIVSFCIFIVLVFAMCYVFFECLLFKGIILIVA